MSHQQFPFSFPCLQACLSLERKKKNASLKVTLEQKEALFDQHLKEVQTLCCEAESVQASHSSEIETLATNCCGVRKMRQMLKKR